MDGSSFLQEEPDVSLHGISTQHPYTARQAMTRAPTHKARNRPGVDGDAVRIIIGCAGDEYAAAARSRSVWAPSASLASPCPVSPSRAFDQRRGQRARIMEDESFAGDGHESCGCDDAPGDNGRLSTAI